MKSVMKEISQHFAAINNILFIIVDKSPERSKT